MKFKFRYWEKVKYVAAGNPAPLAFRLCGHCGRAWDNYRPSKWTPAPSARCPFEYRRPHAR
jgi:hypothetical protein